MSLGERIKTLRKQRRLTQNKLAELMDLKPITISKYESNDREPNLETLKKLSTVLDIPLIELIDENGIKDVPAKGILKNTNENSSIEQQILAESILEKIGGNSAIFEHLLYEFLATSSVQKEFDYKLDELLNDLSDLSQFMFYMLKLKIIEINSKHK